MAKAQKTIELSWRDENYGNVYGSVAFRAWVEPHPSDTEHTRLARVYKKHGFEANNSRAAWIAPAKDLNMPVRLTEALQAIGYEVAHAGAVPQVLRTPAEAPAVPGM